MTKIAFTPNMTSFTGTVIRYDSPGGGFFTLTRATGKPTHLKYGGFEGWATSIWEHLDKTDWFKEWERTGALPSTNPGPIVVESRLGWR